MNSLRKVLVWRLLSLTVASFISVAYLGEWGRPLILTGILTVVMTILHFAFERLWEGGWRGPGARKGEK